MEDQKRINHELHGEVASQQVNPKPHPIQDLNKDGHGTVRFRENKIVRELLDFSGSRGMSMNDIAMRGYSREDRVQFAQLIGYSLGGFGDLSYVNDDDYAAAQTHFESGNGLSAAQQLQERNNVLQEQLKALQDGVKKLFNTADQLGMNLFDL